MTNDIVLFNNTVIHVHYLLSAWLSRVTDCCTDEESFMKPASASALVKTAALLVAAPALLLPMKAAGQQMSVGGPRPTAVATQPLTTEECKIVAVAASQVVQKVLTSEDFRRSMLGWINPSTFGCNGPTAIVIRSDQDAGAYSTIRSILASPPNSIDVQTRAGLRTVKPQASLVPGN